MLRAGSTWTCPIDCWNVQVHLRHGAMQSMQSQHKSILKWWNIETLQHSSARNYSLERRGVWTVGVPTQRRNGSRTQPFLLLLPGCLDVFTSDATLLFTTVSVFSAQFANRHLSFSFHFILLFHYYVINYYWIAYYCWWMNNYYLFTFFSHLIDNVWWLARRGAPLLFCQRYYLLSFICRSGSAAATAREHSLAGLGQTQGRVRLTQQTVR